MQYRSNRYIDKKPDTSRKNSGIIENAIIPMPDENEVRPSTDEKKQGLASIFNNIFKGIGIEELILIGLIILLFTEGIEDEMLIILLIYVLIT